MATYLVMYEYGYSREKASMEVRGCTSAQNAADTVYRRCGEGVPVVVKDVYRKFHAKGGVWERSGRGE